MDHKTAVAVLINAMQSEDTPEGIQKEIETLLQTVVPEEREAVLKAATEQYKRLQAGLPFDPNAA